MAGPGFVDTGAGGVATCRPRCRGGGGGGGLVLDWDEIGCREGCVNCMFVCKR